MNRYVWDKPPCPVERLGERFLSGVGHEFVWNGCGGCRGDEWKWSCEGEGIEQEIACAWWHAWEDLSIEQRSASEMLGYHVKHGSGSWRNTTNQNAERWGPGECPCILLPQSAYDSCSDLSTCDSCSDLEDAHNM